MWFSRYMLHVGGLKKSHIQIVIVLHSKTSNHYTRQSLALYTSGGKYMYRVMC